MKWRFIDKRLLMLLHDETLAEHGGSSGLRDEGLLDSALARAPNLALHAKPDTAALAASVAFGLAKNHPFVDGNKRAAFLSIGLFLALNGMRLTASQAEATLAIFGLAAGELDEAGLANWIRSRSAKR